MSFPSLRGLTAAAVLLAIPLALHARPDVIFDFDFEDTRARGADVVPACSPEPPEFPPAGYQLANANPLDEIWRSSTDDAIGSGLAQVRLGTGTFHSYPFNRNMFPAGDVHAFQGDTSNVGVGAVGASHRFVAISECLGDLRRAQPNAADPTLQSGCRVYPAEGPFLYVNWGAPRPGMCNLDPARVYVFNVVLDDPADGYDADTLCNPELGRAVCAFRMSILPGD